MFYSKYSFPSPSHNMNIFTSYTYVHLFVNIIEGMFIISFIYNFNRNTFSENTKQIKPIYQHN